MEMMEQDERMYATYTSSEMTKTAAYKLIQDVESPQCNVTGLEGTASNSERLKVFLGNMAGGMTNIREFVEGVWELGTGPGEHQLQRCCLPKPRGHGGVHGQIGGGYQLQRCCLPKPRGHGGVRGQLG